MANATSEQLRAMADHRGLKLVRSRKRTPGVGDYGKYGLTDPAGKPLLGIGDAGLTASAQEIEDYLRGSALNTWKLSAETTPDAAPTKKRSRVADDAVSEAAPVRRERNSRAAPPARRMAPPARRAPPEPSEQRKPPQKPALRLVPKAEPGPPPLKLRSAAPTDAKPLASLLGQLVGAKNGPARIAENLVRVCKAKTAGLIIAERGDIIGCCGWAAVPTLQHGIVGRLTILIIDKDHRRAGTGSALITAAERALEKAGCGEVEAMSDIMVANAHNFFRSLGFEQKSYRFVRKIGA
ncbi:MAG: GNAT family N-acetyltransferase [Sphingomonadales bacterium]|nr:MAG: GNAT family N-acetyltransferase [Sphingomonadales bacterium]